MSSQRRQLSKLWAYGLVANLPQHGLAMDGDAILAPRARLSGKPFTDAEKAAARRAVQEIAQEMRRREDRAYARLEGGR